MENYLKQVEPSAADNKNKIYDIIKYITSFSFKSFYYL